MDLKNVVRGRPVVIALVAAAGIALLAIGASMTVARTAQAEYTSSTLAPAAIEKVAQPTAIEMVDEPPVGVAFVPEGGADLWLGPDREQFFRIHEGLALPFLHRSEDWLLVTTTCDDTAWVKAQDVVVQAQNKAQPTGSDFDISQATIVLDPGHGDRDWGGVGPSGLGEKEVNLDIADRLRTLLESSQDVDWDTGAISSGSTVPAFRIVVLTRDLIGANGGDFEAGLGYRATLGTAAGADAFVSIHNNTVPNSASDIPGSEVYYSAGVADSDRLAGLIYEELLRSFAAFDADWSGGELLGARARLDPETDDDYYGLLRRATMPAVIVEGVYISEPDEEALLETGSFREAYAEAVYRGIVRFLSTAEAGASVNSPEYFHYDAGTVSGNGCQMPAQP